MAGGIDEVELVENAVVGAVVEADGVGFDGDPALAFQVHGIEDLLHHFALREGSGDFEQAVGEGALAVVDVRNDREIPNEFAIHVVGGWPEFQLSHKGAPLHGTAASSRIYSPDLQPAKQVIHGDSKPRQHFRRQRIARTQNAIAIRPVDGDFGVLRGDQPHFRSARAAVALLLAEQ